MKRVVRVIVYEGDDEWVDDMVKRRQVVGTFHIGRNRQRVIREVFISNDLTVEEDTGA